MPITVNINEAAVAAVVRAAWRKGLPLLSQTVLDDCNQYCKMDTGMLIASSLIHSRPSEGKLVWQTPYAKRQYWEIQTAHPLPNPNASWKWCEVAKQRRAAQWTEQAQRLMERNL